MSRRTRRRSRILKRLVEMGPDAFFPVPFSDDSDLPRHQSHKSEKEWISHHKGEDAQTIIDFLGEEPDKLAIAELMAHTS